MALTPPNTRTCGTCVHLDGESLPSGLQYCWRFYVWRHADEVVPDCDAAERATGKEPPGKLHFEGQRIKR